MIFLLLYIGLLTNFKFSMLKTILILASCFIYTSLQDIWFIFYSDDGGYVYLLATILALGILVGVGQVISAKKGFRSVFTVLFATDFILPGDIVCYITYNRTNDIFSSIVLQVMIQMLIFIFLARVVVKYYRENENDSVSWSSICLIPLLFYLSITCLSVWPMNIVEFPEATPGVMLLFLLMIITFSCGIRIYTKKGMKQKNDMSLVFLAEYSDRLKNESAKVNEMNARIEEMNAAMISVTSEILELLDEGRYSDIRMIIMAIKTDSGVIASERKCANNSLNLIMLEAENHAKKSGVKITFNLNVPERLGAIEFEYAVIVERLVNSAINSCRSFCLRELSISMYPSGALMNIEMKSRLAEQELFESGKDVNAPEVESLTNKIQNEVNRMLGIPELNAFMKKYEVHHSVQVKAGVLISEFNVRIN